MVLYIEKKTLQQSVTYCNRWRADRMTHTFMIFLNMYIIDIIQENFTITKIL